jgi:hypothetical protein
MVRRKKLNCEKRRAAHRFPINDDYTIEILDNFIDFWSAVGKPLVLRCDRPPR